MATLWQVDQFFDDEGKPLTSGVIKGYQEGTSTPMNFYADQDGTVLGTSVILSSSGRVPETGIWLQGAYKITIENSTGTLLYTLDFVREYDQRDFDGLTATIKDLNSTTTTAFTVDSRYGITTNDRGKMVLVDASGAEVIIDLLAIPAAGNKFIVTIKKIDKSSNAVKINGGSPQEIDGLSDYYLHNYFDSVILHCDGNAWFIMAAKLRDNIKSITDSEDLELKDDKRLFLVDASGGAVDLKLPAPTDVGTGWKVRGKKIDSSSNRMTFKQNGAETIDGKTEFGIVTQYAAAELITNGINWHVANEFGDISAQDYPYKTLKGLEIKNDAKDAEHDIEIKKGAARSEDDKYNMILAQSLIKRVDSDWKEGSDQGGFPSGLTLTPLKWYHVFAIVKDNGLVDGGFDEKLDASNLLADATEYKSYRRLGSIWINTTTEIDPFIFFLDLSGRRTVYWSTSPTLLIMAGLSGTAPLKTPKDVPVEAIINVRAAASSAGTGIYHLYLWAPSVGQPSVANLAMEFSLDVIPVTAGQFKIYTDTDSKIEYLSDSITTTVDYTTIGWSE